MLIIIIIAFGILDGIVIFNIDIIIIIIIIIFNGSQAIFDPL